MSAVLTTYGRQLMQTAFWAPDQFVAPATIQLALTRAVPESNATGASLDEPPEEAGYARAPYGRTSAFWTPTGYGELFNAQQAFFPAPTDDWDLLMGLAIVDAAAVGTGNVLLVASLSEPFTPSLGVSPVIDIGDITQGLYE